MPLPESFTVTTTKLSLCSITTTAEKLDTEYLAALSSKIDKTCWIRGIWMVTSEASGIKPVTKKLLWSWCRLCHFNTSVLSRGWILMVLTSKFNQFISARCMDSTTLAQLQWCRPKPKEFIQNKAYNNFSRFSQECDSSLPYRQRGITLCPFFDQIVFPSWICYPNPPASFYPQHYLLMDEP